MVLVEVCDERLVQDETGRSPGSFLGIIAFPVHEVLKATAPMTTGKQRLDCEGFPSVDDVGVRRGSRVGQRGWVTVGLICETWNVG